MYPNSRNGGYKNLIFVLSLLSLMLVPVADSLIAYTATVGITPQNNIITLDPDSATMLMEITAESGPDSSAVNSANILNLLIDNDLATGGECIYNYAGRNKDYAQCYRIDSEPSNYSKVEIRVYFLSLEVTPYQWQVYVYQSDANNINTALYVDGSSSTIGWTTIDVTSIIHQLDGQGFMKVRFISRVSQANKGKIAFISKMELQLTP